MRLEGRDDMVSENRRKGVFVLRLEQVLDRARRQFGKRLIGLGSLNTNHRDAGIEKRLQRYLRKILPRERNFPQSTTSIYRRNCGRHHSPSSKVNGEIDERSVQRLYLAFLYHGEEES
jgi:hypothetical protein